MVDGQPESGRFSLGRKGTESSQSDRQTDAHGVYGNTIAACNQHISSSGTSFNCVELTEKEERRKCPAVSCLSFPYLACLACLLSFDHGSRATLSCVGIKHTATKYGIPCFFVVHTMGICRHNGEPFNVCGGMWYYYA